MSKRGKNGTKGVLVLLRVYAGDVWKAPAFAVVSLNQDSAQHYLGLIQAAQELEEKHSGFYTMSLFDYRPTWYEYVDALDQLLLDREWGCFSPQKLAFLNFPQQQGKIVPEDSTTVQVEPNEIHWHSYMKHTETSCSIETMTLPLDALREIAVPSSDERRG